MRKERRKHRVCHKYKGELIICYAMPGISLSTVGSPVGTGAVPEFKPFPPMAPLRSRLGFDLLLSASFKDSVMPLNMLTAPHGPPSAIADAGAFPEFGFTNADTVALGDLAFVLKRTGVSGHSMLVSSITTRSSMPFVSMKLITDWSAAPLGIHIIGLLMALASLRIDKVV